MTEATTTLTRADPQPVRTLGIRITAWRVEDIRDLIQRCNLIGESPYVSSSSPRRTNASGRDRARQSGRQST